MTPEQDQQWRELAQPGILAIREGHADTLDGIWKANGRLRAYMPAWAVQQRYDLVWDIAKRHHEYLFPFTDCVEIAATGIYVLYGSRENLLVVYRRVYFRFIYEMLKPIVDWAIAAGVYDKFPKEFVPLHQVCLLCAEVLEILNTSGSVVAASKVWASLDLVGEPLPKETCLEENSGYVAGGSVFRVAELCHWGGKPFLRNSEPWWKWPRKRRATWKWPQEAGVTGLMILLQHWPVWSAECDIQATGILCSNRIAEVFLVGLEAECPPPDWLPRDLEGVAFHG
ncbi:MAG: hypothetical protein QM758_05150 [Armatimonas sp.]